MAVIETHYERRQHIVIADDKCDSEGSLPVETSRKHSSFCHTQHEAGGEQSSIVGDEALADGDQAEPEHTQAQPNIRL